MKQIPITEKEANQRLDKFLLKYMNKSSKGFIYKMLRKKRIKYNGKKAEGNEMLQIGDLLHLYLAEDTIDQMQEEKQILKIPRTFEIGYEDENILLCGKPTGLLVHPDQPEDRNTLSDQVLYYLWEKQQYDPTKENTFTPAICNRLDRNTSGLVIVGKNLRAVQTINEVIHEHQIDKFYRTIVKGVVKKSGTLEGYHTKDENTNRVEIQEAYKVGSKKVMTRYRPIMDQGEYTLLEVQLITGKSHQIRSHLAEIGHPIIGDNKYGEPAVNRIWKQKYGLSHQLLHAYKIVWKEKDSFLSYLAEKDLTVPVPILFQKIQEDLFSGKI